MDKPKRKRDVSDTRAKLMREVLWIDKLQKGKENKVKISRISRKGRYEKYCISKETFKILSK